MKIADFRLIAEKKYSSLDMRDIDYIIMNILSIDYTALHSNADIDDNEWDKVYIALDKHNDGMPVNRVIGKACFYGYDIKINEYVLAPRPDTEILVSAVIDDGYNAQHRILDLCTGSAAIAIALQRETGAIIDASDISSFALDVARGNVYDNNADVNIIESNMFIDITHQYNAIVSNPPYITLDELKELDKSVYEYDPHLALYGGVDGLDFYRDISLYAQDYLVDGGKLYLEIGDTQAESVIGILTLDGYTDIMTIQDYGHRDRVIVATKGVKTCTTN